MGKREGRVVEPWDTLPYKLDVYQQSLETTGENSLQKWQKLSLVTGKNKPEVEPESIRIKTLVRIIFVKLPQMQHFCTHMVIF